MFGCYLSFLMFLMSGVMLCMFIKHLMLLIISLEFIVMIVLFNLFHILMFTEINMFIYMFLMLFFVCEGALSLSLVVLVLRYSGNDYINSLSMLKW